MHKTWADVAYEALLLASSLLTLWISHRNHRRLRRVEGKTDALHEAKPGAKEPEKEG